MNRTLQQLKESIETLIQNQGEDAPVAAFIFTKEDVFTLDENCEQHPLPLTETKKILNRLDEADVIYSEIFDYIDGEILNLNK